MRQEKILHLAIATGWFVTSLAALLVSTIIVPEASRSAYFWLRVCWTELLIFLFWGSGSFYLFASVRAKDHMTRFGGIAPTIFIVTVIYVLLSFAAMMIHAFIPVTDGGNRIHLVSQIVFFSGATLCVVFLSISRAGASAGLAFDKSKAMSPRDLHDLIALSESKLSDGKGYQTLKASMKQLREVLLYSLNESASLATSTEYQKFSGQIQAFCLAVDRVKQHSEDDENRYLSQTETARSLAAQVKLISSNQVRR